MVEEQQLFLHQLNLSLGIQATSMFYDPLHTPQRLMDSIRATDFGRKYIWPNAVLPSPTALITAAYKATSGRLTLESVEDVSTF